MLRITPRCSPKKLLLRRFYHSEHPNFIFEEQVSITTKIKIIGLITSAFSANYLLGRYLRKPIESSKNENSDIAANETLSFSGFKNMLSQGMNKAKEKEEDIPKDQEFIEQQVAYQQLDQFGQKERKPKDIDVYSLLNFSIGDSRETDRKAENVAQNEQKYWIKSSYSYKIKSFSETTTFYLFIFIFSAFALVNRNRQTKQALDCIKNNTSLKDLKYHEISYDRVFRRQIFWSPQMLFQIRKGGLDPSTATKFLIPKNLGNQFLSNLYDTVSHKNLASMIAGLSYLSAVLYYTNVKLVQDQNRYLTNSENYKFWLSLSTNLLFTPLLCRSILQIPVITTGLLNISNCYLLNFYLFHKDRGTLIRNSKKTEEKISTILLASLGLLLSIYLMRNYSFNVLQSTVAGKYSYQTREKMGQVLKNSGVVLAYSQPLIGSALCYKLSEFCRFG